MTARPPCCMSAVHDQQCDCAARSGMLAVIRALLAQLEGYPVKHPQQAKERELARWMIGGKDG